MFPLFLILGNPPKDQNWLQFVLISPAMAYNIFKI